MGCYIDQNGLLLSFSFSLSTIFSHQLRAYPTQDDWNIRRYPTQSRYRQHLWCKAIRSTQRHFDRFAFFGCLQSRRSCLGSRSNSPKCKICIHYCELGFWIFQWLELDSQTTDPMREGSLTTLLVLTESDGVQSLVLPMLHASVSFVFSSIRGDGGVADILPMSTLGILMAQSVQ